MKTELLKNSRRTFLKQSAKAGLLFGAVPFIPANLLAASTYEKLTILHTNDVHSRIEPFPEKSKYPGLGGAARRTAIVNEIRKQEDNVLLLDAGDIFQGTPYFNVYGGEAEFKLMSLMQYDAATLGNHDFDAGIDGFVKQFPHAKFPFVNCNYNFANSKMDGLIRPYQVIEKGKLRIGITGVGIELDGLVPDKLFGNVVYQNPIEKLNQTARLLKKDMDCDFVICLSHLGYKYQTNKVSDVALAEQSEDIDVILGGHTHTFMEQPEKVLNKNGEDVIIKPSRLGRYLFGQN